MMRFAKGNMLRDLFMNVIRVHNTLDIGNSKWHLPFPPSLSPGELAPGDVSLAEIEVFLLSVALCRRNFER